MLGNLEQPGLHSQYGNFRTALYAKLAHDPAQTIANGRLRLIQAKRNLLVRLPLSDLLNDHAIDHGYVDAGFRAPVDVPNIDRPTTAGQTTWEPDRACWHQTAAIR